MTDLMHLSNISQDTHYTSFEIKKQGLSSWTDDLFIDNPRDEILKYKFASVDI